MTDLVRAAEYHLGLNNAEYLRDAQQVDAANQKMASGFDQLAVEEARVTQTTQVMGNEFERLEGRYDRLIQIETRRRNALEQSQRIAAEEGISAERLGAQIARVNAKFDDQVAALSRVRGPLQQATATSRGFGSAIQQAGFQVGDFAVQIASGQGVLRPLIQQGTQLISMFGPWGAVIGAAGAVVGALATSFMAVEEATDKASDALEAYNKAMEASEDLTRALHGQNKTTVANLEAERRLRVGMAEAALAEAQAKIQAAKAAALDAQNADPVIGFGEGVDQSTQIARNNALKNLEEIKRINDEIILQQRKLRAENLFGGEMMDPFAAMGTDHSGSHAGAEGAANDNGGSGSGGGSGRSAQSRAIEEQRSALVDLIQTEEDELDLLRLSGAARTALERQRTIEAATIQAQAAAQKDYNAGLRDSPLMTGEELARIQELTAANYDLTHVQEERGVKAIKINEEISESTRMLEGFLDQSFDRIGGGITEALATGQIEMAKLGDIGRAVVSELMQLFMQLAITNPLKNLALGQDNPVLSDVFGSLVSGIGSWFGGGLMADPNGAMLGRASGGRVKAGGAYWVGESGPEPFYPDQNGVIEPNWSAMRGANANAAPVNVTVIDQRKSGEAVETQSQRRADGGTDIRIIVRDMMRKEISDGAFDRQLATRYGSTLQPA